MNRHLRNSYIREIKKNLNSSCENSIQLIRTLTQNVDNYLKEHPDADLNALYTTFGTPDDIVESVVDSMDSKEFTKQFSFKKKTSKIIIAAIITLAVFCGIVFAVYYYNLHKDIPSYNIDELGTDSDIDESELFERIQNGEFATVQ